MKFEKFTDVDWRKPLDRGRTPSENRAAIAKVDELVATTGCTKTEAFCRVGIHFNTYYKIKRADGVPPTPACLTSTVRAANNCGGPGKPKGYRVEKGKCGSEDTPLRRIRDSLQAIDEAIAMLKKSGVKVEVLIG